MDPKILIRLFLPEILAVLQMTIKNPKSLASELEILIETRDVLSQLIAEIQVPPQA